MAWSYFHKLYETDSTLSRNFLLVAPNIIVLDRLRADFDGLRIFFNDPVLPQSTELKPHPLYTADGCGLT
jgi:type III restriction enzyme